MWSFFPAYELGVSKTFKQNLPGLKDSITYTRNKFGYRALSMESLELPDNTFRIFCLGGSTTDQATQETQDTWCSLLEIALNSEFSDYDIEFQAVGRGRGGAISPESAWFIRENIDKLNPDLVIFMQGINDLLSNGSKRYPYISVEERL